MLAGMHTESVQLYNALYMHNWRNSGVLHYTHAYGVID